MVRILNMEVRQTQRLLDARWVKRKEGGEGRLNDETEVGKKKRDRRLPSAWQNRCNPRQAA